MVSENFDIEFQSRFDELMKARRVSVGEIRVHSNGVKYQKQPDGSWKPVKGQEGEFRPFRSETDFGKDFKQFKGYPKEAILYLTEVKEGQVKGVWEREDVGSIDLVWGNSKQGLRHIIKSHLRKDFSSYKDMAKKIDTILRKGELSKDKNDYILTYGDYRVVLLDITVYDKNDNFNDKRFILTSYNHVISKEDKKSSSSKLQSNSAEVRGTTLKKSLGCNTPNNSVLQHGLSSVENKSHFSLIDSFYKEESGRSCSSLPKDTTNTNDMQQFMDEIIEKSKKGAPIGTERTYSNGKTYIKTENGWKPKSGAKKAKKEDDQTDKTSSKVNDVNSYASKASDEQLQAAINDKDALSEVKQAAQKEIESRKDKTSDDKSADELGITSALQRILDAQEKGELDLGLSVINKIKEKLAKNKEEKKNKPIDEKTLDSKLDKLKQDISDSIDKKLNEINGFKKITQTYVKVDVQTIVLNMKGEDKYKAKKGSFYMESKPNEPLNEFKKRVKEEFEKTLKKESKQEPVVESKKPESTKVEEKNNLKFEIEEEFREFLKKRNSQNDTLPDDQRERFAKILDSVTIDEYIEREFKDFIKNEEFDKILEKYAKLKTEYRAAINKMLIDSGYLPVANGVLYSEWNNVKYKNFTGSILEDKTEMERYYKEQGKKLKVTKTQSEALERYMGIDYEIIRDYNYGKGGGKDAPLIAQAIAEVIDKNPCKENLVLYRRLEARKINSLNELLNAKVGSIIEDKSFGSFSLKQLNEFGSDFQITLLAKKGDKVANINNAINEYEYLTQRLSKFKVLAKGLNSIVVEMV